MANQTLNEDARSWLAVVAAFLTIMTCGIFASFGIFVNPLAEEFRWSRAEISGAFSLSIIVFSISTVAMGSLTDRLGPRTTIGIGGALVGIGLALTSFSSELWQLYLSFGVIASLGSGAFYVPPITAIARRFSERRGLVLGITGNGYSAGLLLFAPMLEMFIASQGWRWAFLLAGIIAWGFMGFGAAVLNFPQQEREKTQMDGRAKGVGLRGLLDLSLLRQLKHSVSTKAFVVLLLALTIVYLAFGFMVAHLVPLMSDLGIPSAIGALAISFIGVGGIIGKIVLGSASDRFGSTRALGFALIFQVLAFAILLLAVNEWQAISAAFTFGFANDAAWILVPAATARLFSAASQGAILGLLEGISAGVGGSLGSYMGGLVYDFAGNYLLAMALITLLTGVAALLAFTLTVPRK